MNRKGDYSDHIKELARKGRMAARKTWGLGERLCKNDFKRRWMLFKYLVQSVMEYGVELWGWEEKVALEKIMMDYVRWMFRLDFCTPRYLISRELRMDSLKIGWGIRAMRFEEKVRNKEKDSLLRRCWDEKLANGWSDRYSKERERYYNRMGWNMEEIEISRSNGKNLEDEVILREQDSQRSREDEKISLARYNIRYKDINPRESGPRYLHVDCIDDVGRGEEIRALLKLRCGNLEEANKYWLCETEWECVFCGCGKDCVEHYIEECPETKEWFVSLSSDKHEVYRILYDDELGIEKGEILRRLWKTKEARLRVRHAETGCDDNSISSNI